MDIAARFRDRIMDVPDFPKQGIVFKDLTPVLADPQLIKDVCCHLAEHYRGNGLDAIAGIESRGFLFGIQLAIELHLPFIPIRKEGKLPREKVRVAYDLEYGSAGMEAHADAVRRGWKVLVHDDLLATGGTAEAAGKIIQQLGGEVAGFSFLIELGFLKGKDRLADFGVEVHNLVSFR